MTLRGFGIGGSELGIPRQGRGGERASSKRVRHEMVRFWVGEFEVGSFKKLGVLFLGVLLGEIRTVLSPHPGP